MYMLYISRIWYTKMEILPHCRPKYPRRGLFGVTAGCGVGVRSRDATHVSY
jgi:hypothetical protein